MSKKDIVKKGPLGTAIKLEGDDSDYSPDAIKKTLEEKGLQATETVEVKNPVTGKTSIVTIERDGTPESKVVLALTDKNLTRDQKDHVLGMYLFERGKDNASFLMDLFRYKGQNTKETRAFKSQVRFDFEMFVNLFTGYLDKSAEDIFRELSISSPRALLDEYVAYIAKDKENATLGNFLASKGMNLVNEAVTLLALGFRNLEESARIKMAVSKVAEQRMKDKGFGIYIAQNGQSYSIFEDDIEGIIKEDRERIEELSKEE